VKDAQFNPAGRQALYSGCQPRHPEDGAREGAIFIRDHIMLGLA
jgi:hypothetical protein